MITRRNFIKKTSLSTVALTGSFQAIDSFSFTGQSNDLYALSSELVETWAKALLALQVTDKSRENEYGGIICPTFKIVHGRIGDTIYPFFYMASKTKESKYLDSALLLYRWMERSVGQEDGSWLNEPVKGSWKGTTVFSIIALCETLKNHGALMDKPFKDEVEQRLKKAGDYVYNTFNIDYGNINYPIAASYGLSILGELLDIQKFQIKGKELAHQALKFISAKDKLIYGEGDPYYEASKKGCFSVDLGYNVEESLPSLALYGLLTKDQEVLERVVQSMQAHLEFMLPDGGWDNSWGTRNYKWTYWGSRTSDGCQPAYALLSDRDPRFYKAAFKNTQLLQQSTKGGLLHGGPHYATHGVQPSVHHTFCHIKALTTILDHKRSDVKIDMEKITLPRESVYGNLFFSDIQTHLISKGKYRATITAYDREYKKTKNGHATGGALTMLWHEKAGILLAGSMNEYQLFEAGNMQTDNDPNSMTLTPRIELKSEEGLFMNISDLNAVIEVTEDHDKLIIQTKSKLVDKDQKNPSSGEINCNISYQFTNDIVIIKFSHDKKESDNQIKIIFPVISASTEKLKVTSDKMITVTKENSSLKISSDQKIIQLPTTKGRIFNFVPGLEAIPLCIEQNNATIEFKVE